MQELLNGTDYDGWLSTCKEEVGALDFPHHHLAHDVYRCIAEKGGLISDNSTGRFNKRAVINRINDNPRYSAEKKQILKNQMTKCQTWDSCHNKFCV